MVELDVQTCRVLAFVDDCQFPRLFKFSTSGCRLGYLPPRHYRQIWSACTLRLGYVPPRECSVGVPPAVCLEDLHAGLPPALRCPALTPATFDLCTGVKMEPRTMSPHWDGSRLSPSSPRPRWPQQSPSSAPPASDAGPSRYANQGHHKSIAKVPDRKYSSTPGSHRGGDLRSSSRNDCRSTNTISDRPCTTPSQPVLVRAYSGNTEDATGTTGKQSAMSARRLFPFTGSRSSTTSHASGPPLPTANDFSIENILQAIEPDISETLNSIAEICGRSKLSLANEYGSHIAPLGEIRAPPGGLVPVEEASASEEQGANEGVIAFDSDPRLVDAGGNLHPFSFYRYLESFQQAASVLERNGAGNPGSSTQPNITRVPLVNAGVRAAPQAEVPDLPATREIASRPKGTARHLLAKTAVPSQTAPRARDIATPAVLSEVYMDAHAAGRHVDFDTRCPSPIRPSISGHSTLDVRHPLEALRLLPGWIRWAARTPGSEARDALQSAECRLRTMLERSAEESLPS